MADVPMGSGETKAPSQCHDRELFAPLRVVKDSGVFHPALQFSLQNTQI